MTTATNNPGTTLRLVTRFKSADSAIEDNLPPVLNLATEEAAIARRQFQEAMRMALENNGGIFFNPRDRAALARVVATIDRAHSVRHTLA